MKSEMKACARWRSHAKRTDRLQVLPMSSTAVPPLPLAEIPVPRGRRHCLGQLVIVTPGRGMRRVRILELVGITLHMRLPTLRHCARPHLWHHASHGLLHVSPHWESGIHRTRERERGSLCTLVSRPASIRLIPASGSSRSGGSASTELALLVAVLATLAFVLITLVTLSSVQRGPCQPCCFRYKCMPQHTQSGP